MGTKIGIAAVGIALLALSACATGEDPAVIAPTPTAAEEAPAAGATVQLVDSEHGMILADADGETLYAFLNDEGGESSCYDSCAQNWPALIAEGEPTAGEGVTGELGTTERQDGSQQVTVGGAPLYHYSGDQQAGDTNGQGVGDVWFVVGPDGSPVRG